MAKNKFKISIKGAVDEDTYTIDYSKYKIFGQTGYVLSELVFALADIAIDEGITKSQLGELVKICYEGIMEEKAKTEED